MMGREVRISDAEWDVMEVVWGGGSATAAKDIETPPALASGITARFARCSPGWWRRAPALPLLTAPGTSTGPP